MYEFYTKDPAPAYLCPSYHHITGFPGQAHCHSPPDCFAPFSPSTTSVLLPSPGLSPPCLEYPPMSHIPWSVKCQTLHFPPQNPLSEYPTRSCSPSLCQEATVVSTRCLLGLIPGILYPPWPGFISFLIAFPSILFFKAGLGHYFICR